MKKHKTILDYPGAKNLSHTADILEQECDILVPAALENQITSRNVNKIKAKIIGEGANGPITPDADEILSKRGVLIIPDIYLNAGGVTVSYFEWLKNLSHVRFGRMSKRFEENMYGKILHAVEDLSGKHLSSKLFLQIAHGPDEEDLVNSGLEDTMICAYHEIRNIRRKNKDRIDLRTAAFINAIEKIVNCYMELGIFP